MKRKTTKTPEIQESSILEIDRNELDREWAMQPKLYHKYADDLARARKALDEAEAAVKVVRADIDKRIRKNPSKYDLPDKPTETAIANTILLRKQFIEAQNAVIEAQFSVNILYAMTTSLDHKKAALENMVRLHGQDYFSTPKTDAKGYEKLEKERSNTVARKCVKQK
ncbi:MAG: hypothetical protein RBT66_00655 [bacterium]|nr:hypothetical protein [bacterium]